LSCFFSLKLTDKLQKFFNLNLRTHLLICRYFPAWYTSACFGGGTSHLPFLLLQWWYTAQLTRLIFFNCYAPEAFLNVRVHQNLFTPHPGVADFHDLCTRLSHGEVSVKVGIMEFGLNTVLQISNLFYHSLEVALLLSLID